MRDQMSITGQLEFDRAYGDICEASYAPRSFWMEIFPPLEERRIEVSNARAVCPWTMAAELRDFSVAQSRRKNILEALKMGLTTMNRYHLPAARILFVQDIASKEITVWVD